MTFEKSFINSKRKSEGKDYRLKIVNFSSSAGISSAGLDGSC